MQIKRFEDERRRVCLMVLKGDLTVYEDDWRRIGWWEKLVLNPSDFRKNVLMTEKNAWKRIKKSYKNLDEIVRHVSCLWAPLGFLRTRTKKYWYQLPILKRIGALFYCLTTQFIKRSSIKWQKVNIFCNRWVVSSIGKGIAQLLGKIVEKPWV